MKKTFNTFQKGINRDLSKNKYDNEHCYDVELLRLITDDGLSSFALVNPKGNSLSVSLDSGWSMHGVQAYTTVRNYLIILAIGNNPGVNDRIYKYTIGSTGGLTGSYIYTGNLGFGSSYPILRVISRYESDEIIKIYWTDGNSNIKFCNIEDPNISSLTAKDFDSIPSVTFDPIVINSIGIGALKAGMVQYSYQLYNLYGAESNFIPPSSLLPLSDSPTTGSDILFKGNNEGESAGKSVTFTVDNVDTTFNRIRVVRIFYTNILVSPEITVIEETTTDTSMTFTDTGLSNLGTLTLDEFNLLKYDFTCQDLETKNNILFAANIKENIWNVTYDARTYRFNSNQRAYPCDFNTPMISPTGVVELIGPSPDYTNIPETHDAWNPYNNFTLDGVAMTGITGDKNFKYQSNGTTLGGSGLNISYSFITKDISVDSTASVVDETNSAYWVNPIYASENRGYQRDEVYPFSIVLWRGTQRSYPLWIGDIRFPRMQDAATYGINKSAEGDARLLGIRFNVRNLPADCTHWQIVRCERKTDDRTILAQGLISGIRSYNESGYTWNTPAVTLPTVAEYNGVATRGQTLNKRLSEFISPEINYNKNLTYSGGDQVELIDVCNLAYRYYKTTLTSVPFIDNRNLNFNLTNLITISKVTSTSTSTLVGTLRRNVVTGFNIVNKFEDVEAAIPPLNKVTIGTSSYENYIRKYGSGNLQGYHGTIGIIEHSGADLDFSGITDTSFTYGSKYILANYKRAVAGYGGGTFEARSRRYYISCSDIQTGNSNTTIDIYNGDTFVSLFEYQRAMVSGLVGTTAVNEFYNETFKFPVETTINTRWQSNKNFTQLYSNIGNGVISSDAALIQEVSGIYAKSPLSFTQVDDLYKYNSVYSHQNTTLKYYAKPLDIIDTPTFDIRVQYSNRKFNNEISDSWTKWRPLNYKDVDSQYGSITALINHNSDLICFQPNGICILSVEEREVTQGSNSSQLRIGTGGILDRFDYFTTAAGCSHRNGIITGLNILYWYDTRNNSIYRFNKASGEQNISKMLGIQSYLNKNITGTNLIDVITGYDRKFNNIFFTFIASSWPDGYKRTLVFNEQQNSFSQINKVIPFRYITTDDFLYTSLNGIDIYLENYGNYGQFYGSYYDSKISLLINPDGNLVNRFDIFEWLTEVGSNLQETFNTIRFYNDWQDSGNISLTLGTNVGRLFRTWRFNQVFDSSEQRLKDSYIIVELSFTNNANKKLVVNDIITTYSSTKPY